MVDGKPIQNEWILEKNIESSIKGVIDKLKIIVCFCKACLPGNGNIQPKTDISLIENNTGLALLPRIQYNGINIIIQSAVSPTAINTMEPIL